MKALPRLMIFVAVVGGGIFEVRHLVATGAIPRPSILKSLIPLESEKVTATVLSRPGQVPMGALPTDKPAKPCVDGNTRNCLPGDPQDIEIWAWNANMGLIYAVGGAKTDKGIQTSKGSLMEKHGVMVRMVRQDDTGQMKTDLVDTATRLKSDPGAKGVKFVTVMGDGGAQFFKDLQRLCPSCQFEVVGILGYSRGEDGFWGPKEWADSPAKAKGQLVIGVLRDGDWNIAMQWEAQNHLCNNPDDTMIDHDCVNWINADSYTKAAEMFVQGTKVTLPVKGRLSSAKETLEAKGVVTWTPGDVTVAKKKGGVVPILTTRENVFQMPCILVGIKSWDAAHQEQITQMLSAAFDGADQVASHVEALRLGAEASQNLYREQGADALYWIKYYTGTTEADAMGVPVKLGGSSVANLADNLQAFGLDGGKNLFAAAYTTFGKIVSQQYPNLYPDFPPVTSILNTSYVSAVASKNVSAGMVESKPSTVISSDETAPMRQIEGRRDYTINFATGSDQILPSSIPTMNQLADEIAITKYVVAAHGHTDNTGNADANVLLSERRARSVAAYLHSLGVKNTIRAYGHGQEEPIASNDTAEGRAKNRRVQIVLGVTE